MEDKAELQQQFHQVSAVPPLGNVSGIPSQPPSLPKREETETDGTRTRQKLWKKKVQKLEAKLQSLRTTGVELHNENYRAVTKLQLISVENERLLDLLVDVGGLSEAQPAAKQLLTAEQAESFDIMLAAALESV